jgi:hypothetical protein
MPLLNGGHLWIMLILLVMLALAVFGLLVGIRWAVRTGQPPPARYGAPPAAGYPLPPPPPPPPPPG